VKPLDYVHVDVFAPRPYAGNSLPVFLECEGLDADQMQAITRELRHFESVFLTSTQNPRTFRVRVFDLNEELPFAGHPLIGAAAALHHSSERAATATWSFDLIGRTVSVDTARTASGYFAALDQGRAHFGAEPANRSEVAAAFGLDVSDLDPALPLAVVSTGLAYLIIPVTSAGLARARIRSDVTALVRAAGAQFAVLLDESRREVRHWNNDGVLEDIATGSAAGTIGAYRLRHCKARSGARFDLEQGRFVGRPSRIEVEPHGSPADVASVRVGGNVAIVGRGMLESLP